MPARSGVEHNRTFVGKWRVRIRVWGGIERVFVFISRWKIAMRERRCRGEIFARRGAVAS